MKHDTAEILMGYMFALRKTDKAEAIFEDIDYEGIPEKLAEQRFRILLELRRHRTALIEELDKII